MHFSDVHFGVENYGRYDPVTGVSSRLIDFKKALLAACDEAVARNVEVAIFTGDAYKTRDPNQTHQREFAACLNTLTSCRIPVVLLAGNHDVPNMIGRANAIEIFGALAADYIHVIDTPQVKKIETSTGKTLQVAGLPYLTKSSQLTRDGADGRGVADTVAAVEEKYSAAVRKLIAECAKSRDLPTVFMGHFSLKDAQIGETQATFLINEPTLPTGELAVDAFDYVAMGHIHRYQDLNLGAHPPIVYCGSIERIDFGEAKDTKGVVFADVARRKTEYKFFPTPCRPFKPITVPADEGTGDPTEMILARIAKEMPLTDAVVKLSYTIRSEDVPLVREKEIRAALADAFMVLAINRHIIRGDMEDRSGALAESLDPIKALEIYIDGRDALKGRKETLVEYARALLQEVELTP